MARVTIKSLQDEVEMLRASSNITETALASVKAELEALKAASKAVQPTVRSVVVTERVDLSNVPQDKPHPIDFVGYWDYVRAVKKWCAVTRSKVAYASKEQFAEAHESYDDYLDRCDPHPEFPQGEFAPQCNVGPGF